ncbi:MAG: DUF5317 domain-containing protein [Sedimentibacter saalensis]|jgi:hypothetical protein|uniref:DUF5317 domain-containing protein n=1 Tax=Sedimentibacter saalensis TaxID=130788 RepID=UPI002B1F6693|nr:DUF5317 domain-containing protein [Sedimentibacter saalensis]MEA5096146.1 DUF5317 domain-containing protein [Sedimentibacter saalensis]
MISEIILISILSILIAILILIATKKSPDITNRNFEIKGYKLLILTAVIEITAQFLFKRFPSSSLLRYLSLSWLIYFAIFYVAAINIKKSYMMLFFIGTLLNFITIASNGFKMPVFVSDVLGDVEAKRLYLQTGQDLIHSLLTDKTKFKFLCDIITIPSPYPFSKTISVGDVFLLSGVFAFWQDLLEGKKSRKIVK